MRERNVAADRRGRWSVGSAVVAFAICVGLLVVPQAFAASGNGEIAFDHGLGDPTIWVVNPDGTGLAQLTGNGQSSLYPRWSPDGSKITFESNRTGTYQVYVMAADGSNPTQVTNSASGAFDPSFSANGSNILYDEGGAIMEIPATAVAGIPAAVQVIANNTAAGFAAEPENSPDGAKIAFSGTTGGCGQSGACNLYLYDISSQSLTPLTADSGDLNEAPAWSSSGSRISFKHLESTVYTVRWIPGTGGSETALPVGVYDPAPSPDGTKLAYSTGTGIGISDPDGVGPVTVGVPNTSSYFDLSWQPTAPPPPPGVTYTVNTAADHDDGTCDLSDCTLREAINAANANPNLDTIDFSIGTGVQTIVLSSQLPDIASPVDIEGGTQPGAPAGSKGIVIRGTAGTGDGLVLNLGSDHSTIRGLDVEGFSGSGSAGILVESNDNLIEDNYLGTDATGTAAAANDLGLDVSGSASSNQIGEAGHPNVISGNGNGGVVIDGVDGSDNVVAGNLIGTDVTGDLPLANEGMAQGPAVEVDHATQVTIGGPNAGDGNFVFGEIGIDVVNTVHTSSDILIQGNTVGVAKNGSGFADQDSWGIGLRGGGDDQILNNVVGHNDDGFAISDATNVTVSGNFAGVDQQGNPQPTGDAGFVVNPSSFGGSYTPSGVNLDHNTVGDNPNDGIFFQADDSTLGFNTIEDNGSEGGPLSVAGIEVRGAGNTLVQNTITDNTGAGVRIASGTGNSITGNSIDGNGGAGIDLGNDGPTANDAFDHSSGPNLWEDYPVISNAFVSGSSKIKIGYSLATPLGAYPYTIEFYASASCGSGQGAQPLGTDSLASGTTGSVALTGATGLAPGTVITATATDAGNNTSEFSACFAATAAPSQTYIVTSPDDNNTGSCPGSTCTLRAAVAAANASFGTDTIDFHLQPSGAQTLTLDPTLGAITITDPVTIDGTSEPSFAPFPVGVDIAAGEGPGSPAAGGLTLAGGSDGSTIRGLGFTGFAPEGPGSAIEVDSNENTIVGNLFGVVVDTGPTIDNAAITVTGSNNAIGGGAPGDANVFANVGTGVSVEAAGVPAPAPDGNTIAGNTFGFLANGTTPGLLAGEAISLVGATNTVVGNDDGPGGLADVQAHPELGNLIGGGNQGIFMGFQTTGTIVAGNFIGSTRSGVSSNNANTIGVEATDGSSNNQIGPGNVIAYNDEDGVFIDGATGHPAPASVGNRIVANSIHDNGTLGIDLGPGGNDNLPAPVIDTVEDGVASGTVDGPSGATLFVELFDNVSCDSVDGTAGTTFAGFAQATIPAGQTQTTWTTPTFGVSNGDGVTATSTNGTGGSPADTSQFSHCVVATAVSGSLSGSVTQPTGDHQDLTAAGTTDWAIWGTGNSTSLTPDVRKQGGGSAISALTKTSPTDGAPGNFGNFPFSVGDFGFDWSDGTPTAAGSGVTAGLAPAGVGAGLSFTVPASTSQQTLTVWTSAHYADETLVATLSDGSAQPFSYTLHATPGPPFFNGNENVPAVFALTYAAASAGQQLTVTVTEASTAFGNDDAVIYAAALSPAGSATGGTATLSGGTVGMSGSNDPIDQIPLFAFEPNPPSTPPLQINGLQINGLQINGLPIDDLQINGLQINGLQTHSTQINGLQINGLQINGLQINGLQINGLQINGLQINGLQINGLPITNRTDYPDGWADLLGQSLKNQPLQTITLQDVLDQLNGPDEPEANGHSLHANIQNLTIGDLDSSGSPIGRETVGALTLGSLQINGLPTDLRDGIETQLETWCASVVPAGDPNGVCGPGGTLGTATLFQLGLAGAPIQGLQINGLQINGLQINGLQINGLQINGLATSASAIADMQINGLQINGLQINGLQINGLQINGLPANVQNAVFDCSAIDCATATIGDAAAAGAIRDGATVGQLDVGSFLNGITIGSLLQNVLGANSIYKNTVTFGDLVGLLIKRADVPWESLTPHQLAAFDPSRKTLPLSAGFTLQGSGTSPATVKVTLPAGFDFDFGNPATLTPSGGAASPVADPVESSGANSTTLTFTLPTVQLGTAYALDFTVRSGSDVGQRQASVSVAAGGFTTPDGTAALNVTDAYPSVSPASSPVVAPDTSVQMSALADQGDVDYYRVEMPDKGTRVLVHLTNLPADYDLALYSATSTSVRTGATNGVPLQDGTAPDTSINLQGGPNPQLTPDPIQDVPNPGGGMNLQLVSDNRGVDDEDVAFVSPGGGGNVLIAVYGYHGASDPRPYALRITEQTPPASSNCAPFHFPNSDGAAGTMPSIPTNLNTLILVNEKRLGDQSGHDVAATAIGKLQDLANDTALGVRGLVLPVESIPGVQSAYDTWDQHPCDVGDANAIANLIANEISLVKSTNPNLKYVVFAGGDDQIPFFRTPDLTRIANESGFASSFAPNQYQAALAAGDLLTDNPYLDTRPTPASGGQLFVPNLVGGRLVEQAADITKAVTDFEGASGTLHTASGFVSGYDFVSDGSQQVADKLSRILGGGHVSTLPSGQIFPYPTPRTLPNWSKSNLLGASFPQASITDWNGHFDNTRALMANGTDLLSTSEFGTNGTPTFNGGIFFTMGCHAGFQTSDVVVGGAVLDWAQYFAQQGTQFVGNTGFGLGSTDGVLYSEELMSDFAGNLAAGTTIGDALTQAKDDYFLSRTAYSSYDDKTLSEAELYGLPMYSIGSAPAPLQNVRLDSLKPNAAPQFSQSTDPVNGTSASASPSGSTLGSFPGASVQAAPFTATPSFVLNHGANGDYYTNGGQAQAPNYAPLEPYVNLPATRTGLTAHGVVIDSLTSQDDPSGFNPDNLRPTVDLSANEPEPQFLDEASPSKIPTLVSLDTPDGLEQSLNLATGQFFTQSTGDPQTNVQRRWTQIGGRVTYSADDGDFTPPTIDSVDAFTTPDHTAISFTGKFSDLDDLGNPGQVVFAQVVYDLEDGTGHWGTVQLQEDPTTHAWTGGAPFTAGHVQFFVEVCDAAGNCGFSSNKGRYYDAQPLPPQNTQGGTITLQPTGTQNGSYFTGPVHVDAQSSDSDVTVTVSVDGGPAQDPNNVSITGDGAHTIVANGSDGSTVTTVVLIDTSNPTITVTAPAFVQAGGADTLLFSCADGGSGVATCSATDNGNPISSGATLGSLSAGDHPIVVHATDNAGHSSQSTTTVHVLAGPHKPGTPTASPSPNMGAFTVSWGASSEAGQTITYELQQATTLSPNSWSTVQSGLSPTSLGLSNIAQGVYLYRVIASDGHFTSTSDTSAQVIVDTTKPIAGIGPCPTTVHLNATGLTVPFTASDSGGSGLATPASGTVPLVTNTVGQHTATATATDHAGNAAVPASCQYTVVGPPGAPGGPFISAGPASPNQGAFTLTWGAAIAAPAGDTLTYTLQHKSSNGSYTTVASGLTALTYTFTVGSPEGQNTWTYRVFATDGDQTGSNSVDSDAVKVDRAKPNTPTMQATSSPNNGWFKSSVTVNTVQNGDPTLPDGSAGSGINAALTTAPQTKNVTGTYALTGTVTDNAGNQSTAGSGTFKVDATVPSLTVTCPSAGVPFGSTQNATWSASDVGSGLNGPASGSTSLPTTSLGQHMSSGVTVSDLAGNSITQTCNYTVIPATPVINWSNPAAINYGTKLSATQLNATVTPNISGTFAYTPAAGAVLPFGTNTLHVTFTPQSGNYTTATASVTINVKGSQACLSTTLSGSLTVNSGTAYCILAGGKVTGSVTVKSGGSLWIDGGTVSGTLTSTGATGLSLCNTSVVGGVSISGSTGPVTLGLSSGCAADKLSSTLTLTNNTAGVTVVGDTVTGGLNATGNSGGFVFTNNKEGGSATVSSNSGVIFNGNTVTGGLTAASNAGSATFSANTFGGSISVTSTTGGLAFTNNKVGGSLSIQNNKGGFTYSGNTVAGSVTLKNNT